MPDNKVYVNSIGTRIRLRVFEDDDTENLIGAANTKIYYVKPGDSSENSWTAIIDATTNKHIYFDTTVVGDLDIRGTWQLQSYHEKSGWKGRGEMVEMIIYDNMD